MSSVSTPRLQQLQKLLAQEPDDPFLLYGIGMEYKNANDFDRALDHFNRVLQKDPGYLYAYHQRGLVYEAIGDTESAKQSYREGVAAAHQKGDSHAASEIEAALSMLV